MRNSRTVSGIGMFEEDKIEGGIFGALGMRVPGGFGERYRRNLGAVDQRIEDFRWGRWVEADELCRLFAEKEGRSSWWLVG